MRQPIKENIKEIHSEITTPPTYTLIIDGNNLLRISMVDNKVNSRGECIGGVFQFLLKIKLLLQMKNWDFVYTVWDGEDSGILRYVLYPDYKANREDKNYSNKLTDYDQQINDFVKRTLAYSKRKVKIQDPEKELQKINERECFERQQNILMRYLEELFIRQIQVKKIEGDDLIGYYCKNKNPNDKIAIVSSDRDYIQLVSDDVCVYIPPLKKFVTPENSLRLTGCISDNALLKKIILGDTSDNIKGVKGIGEKTLFSLFPDFKTKKMTLEIIQEEAKFINEQRITEKKKPLQSLENLINGTTDGVQGGNLFEINEKIINLNNPLLTDEAIETMENIMYAPIDPDGRSFKKLYQQILDDDMIDFKTDNKFTSFFSDFKRLANKEINYFNQNI